MTPLWAGASKEARGVKILHTVFSLDWDEPIVKQLITIHKI